MKCVLQTRRGGALNEVGALSLETTRLHTIAKAVALPFHVLGAARARGQPQTRDFGSWTRWAHFAVVLLYVKLGCDAVGQRNSSSSSSYKQFDRATGGDDALVILTLKMAIWPVMGLGGL